MIPQPPPLDHEGGRPRGFGSMAYPVAQKWRGCSAIALRPFHYSFAIMHALLFSEQIMHTSFRFKRGDLITDKQLGGEPYRIVRVLVDRDTEVGLYVIQRVDSNAELLRNAKLIDNPECFIPCVSG